LVWVGIFPESPKFLVLKGRTSEIKDLLSKLRPERSSLYLDARLSIVEPNIIGNSIAALLGPKYRRTTLAIWASAFLSLFCIFGLSGWIPTVMMQRGETFAASFGFGALLQMASFVGAMTIGYLADRSGDGRALMALWWALGGLAVVVLIFADNHLTNASCVAAAGFFIIGAQFVLNNFTAASYHTEVRATAVGMELSVARVGAILGPFIAGALQQVYHSTVPMFVSIGAAAVLAGVAIMFARRPTPEAQVVSKGITQHPAVLQLPGSAQLELR
jgi:MFS family permease